MSDTADLIASLDDLAVAYEADRDPVFARLQELAEARVPARVLDPLPRLFLTLERAAGAVPLQRLRPLMRLHEALSLVRLGGEAVHGDTLLLADLERTHSRVVGPIGSGLRALGALPALQDLTDTGAQGRTVEALALETVFLHLDRDSAFWPADRDADPRLAAMRGVLEEVERVISAEAPALPRLFEARRRVLEAELPRRPIAGAAADPDQGFAGDEDAWIRQVDAVLDVDPRPAFAAIVLAWGIWRIGWTAGPGTLAIADSLRARRSPSSDRPADRISWLAEVLADAAVRSAGAVATLSHAVDRIDAASAGSRDRAQSRLVDSICSQPLTTVSSLASVAGVAQPTALRFLDRLVEAGACTWRGRRESGRIALCPGLVVF
jgi:hypothetical protein